MSVKPESRIEIAKALARSFQEWYDQSTQELQREKRGMPKGVRAFGHWLFCFAGLSLPLFVCGMVYVLSNVGFRKAANTATEIGLELSLLCPLIIVLIFSFCMSYFNAGLHTYEYSLWKGSRFGFWVCLLVVNTSLMAAALGAI